VTVKTPNGKVRLTVSTSVLKSPEFASILCGLRPIPKSWLNKPSYDV